MLGRSAASHHARCCGRQLWQAAASRCSGVRQQPSWDPPRRRRSTQAAAAPEQAQLAAANASKFSEPGIVAAFVAPLPAEVEQRLAAAVALLPGLGPEARVIDVGAGTGCLISHLQAAGARDILAVDLSAAMLQELAARFPSPGSCGNDAGVRTWQGDFLALPAFMGPASHITMNGVFGNFASLRDALLKAAFMLAPGGHLLISHPMGRAWHAQLHESDPGIVPHALPDEAALRALTADLPLQLLALRDEPELYAAVLQVPPGYAFPAAPLVLESSVVQGFGRGSRQLGVPTANMDPARLGEALGRLQRGVYFGWAQVDVPDSWPAADGGVHKMVMNVGRRPTVNTGDEAPTVELHLLHSFSQEQFYGCAIRAVATGYVRPEIKFGGLPQLLARIRADIGIARAQLDEPQAALHRQHPVFE